MIKLVGKGVPLPLGTIHNNKRSLLGLGNLVDLIVKCVGHPAAVNQAFLAADGEGISTTQLLNVLKGEMSLLGPCHNLFN